MNVQNIVFLLPVYNDWKSLKIVLERINKKVKKLKKKIFILLVNDFSKNKFIKVKHLKFINEIKILNLKKNIGSQKAISIGLKYLQQNKKNSIITILDSDGEDDINKIPEMIKNANQNFNKVIVSQRTKRKENFIFRSLYFAHKVLTFLFTWNWISFGNYSAFHIKNLKKILKDECSWLAISATIAKNCWIKKVNAERKKRISGVSKVSFLNLIIHSLRINSVFLHRSFLISFFYILILISFNIFNLNHIIIALIILYNFVLVLIIFLNNQNEYKNSIKLIGKIEILNIS